MTRWFYGGAWYVDATPSGAFVVLYPNSHFVTHLGTVPLPPGESWGVGYVRCTDVGGFRFAGQAHSTENPACWEWYPEAGWISYAPPCFGVSPAIYDFSGALHRSDGSVGSQGYRYVEHDGTPQGRLVSGDATYRYPTGVLYEYSAAADLWIGQAAYDGGGVQVLDGDTLRQLELGDGRFVRVQRSGDHVAVSFLTSAGAVIIQTTLAELRSLPPVEFPAPPPPTPAPPPSPTPFPAARPPKGSHMRVFVKTASFYLGVNPTATPVKLDAHAQPVRDAHGHTIPASGDDVFPVYYGRPGEKNKGGAWETVDLESLGDGTFSALFVESNRQLSIGDDGSLQTRAAGAVGPWETFFATSQPDGLNLLYRVKDGVPVGMLLLEAA